MMTYIGSIDYMMSGAGIDPCLETVYAGNSVAHTMTCHAYSRALGVTTAWSPSTLKGCTNTLWWQLISLDTYIQLLLGEAAGRSRTAKLWVNGLLHQHRFLRSPSEITNKTRLISIIAQCFANDSVQCKQAEGDAERPTVSIALDVSNSVHVVATDAENACEPGKLHTRRCVHRAKPTFLCQRS